MSGGYAAAKYNRTGGLTLAPVTEAGSGAANGVVTGQTLGRFDADNPMLWLLGIGAATLGLIAFNSSVRVGPVHASAGVGKS